MLRTHLRDQAPAAGVCEIRDTVPVRDAARSVAGRSPRGPRQHRCSSPTAARVCRSAATVIVLFSMSSLQAAGPCTPEIAKVVSIQGLVELRRFAPAGSQETGWQAAELNVVLCAGDAVRTHERARAALLLSNETTLRLDQLTALTLAAPEADKASLMDLLAGALHVITRTSRPFKVRTPFVNANVEGTEFLVAVGEQSASVSVYEGRLTADNDRGSVAVASGERAIAAKDAAPSKEVVVHPRDAVQWTLYFPAIFDYSVGAAVARAPGESALQESIALYRKGRLAEAIASLQNVPERLSNPQLFVYRAGLFLLVGRFDEAKPDIERAIALDPRNSDAYSLEAVIAVVQNDKDEALQLADKAVALDPTSAAARISLSYAQQAHFEIERALATVRKAVELDPQNALAWARLAELEMSTDNLERALDAAKRATGLNPELAKTQSVLGFANLTRIDINAAKQAFQKAIELDSADPLPRLGLGLARIREGHLKEGREQIEIATSLDPNQSLIRSYLGKAYYEEKRDKLAATQFGQAKERDPSDPTPWLYDAIRKQTENRPVEALQNLEKSIELNDNRAVYRSRLLLDQDLAARSASLARIYRDLGFDQLALIEAYKSVATDPGDYSAHQFLADAYFDSPRLEIARVSELLQSQLRQPLGIAPWQPQLADGRSFILSGSEPARTGLSEFGSLFNRNQSALQFSGVGGGNHTLGDQLVVSGIHDNLSYSVGQFHFGTDGFRQNDDLRKDIYNAFVQSELSTDAGLQLEVRHTEVTNGDLALRFDPANFSTSSRTHERIDSARLGAHYVFSSNSDIVVSSIFQESNTSFDLGDPMSPFVLEQKEKSAAFEIQHQYRSRGLDLTSGAGHYQIARSLQINGSEVPGSNGSDSNLYGYGQVKLLPYNATVDLGFSYDRLRDLEVGRGQINPKFGVMWSPHPTTTVRAAAFRSVKRAFITDQTLEPTQVAGFNQFFDDLDGAISTRIGGAVDQRLSASLSGGLELSTRNLRRVPFITVGEFDWREQERRAYLYWTSSRSVAFTATYQYEHFERPVAFTGDENIIDLKMHRVPLGVSVFSSSGLSARVNVSFIRQSGEFLDAAGNPFAGSERFWLTDAAVSYRAPRRLGLITIDGRNLFDRRFSFQETDAATPRIATRRLIFARWTLAL